MITLWSPLLQAVAAGLTAHLYFHHREPTSASEHALVLLGVPTIIACFSYFNSTGASLLWSILAGNVVYLLTLSSSIVVYRLSPFHPLARYPGPILARVTRLWALYQSASGKSHERYYALHEKYGDVVRTGPNHLFIRDAKAVPILLGSSGSAGERWWRGRRYEVAKVSGATGSILSILSPTEHSSRRRIWDRAFTPSALQEYEPMLHNRTTKLLGRLHTLEGKTINLGFWLGCFAVDMMGDFAFAGAFDFLDAKNGDGGFQAALGRGTKVHELLGNVPWIRPFWGLMPRSYKKLDIYNLAIRVLNERRDKDIKRKDLFFHLLNEDSSNGHEKLSDPTLCMDAAVALVAGSDTTGVTMSNVIYYLLSNSAQLVRLRAELYENIPADVEYPDMGLLAQLPFLNAVINETLRLQPAVPLGSQRTPPGDDTAVIGNIVVPKGTTVQISPWALHRDTRYFWPHPDSFYPDRWMVDPGTKSSEEFRLEKTAYMPFSCGPQNCVGKQLALNEIRLVISTLIRNFDIGFAPAWDPSLWEESLTSTFILQKGELPVVLTSRST